MKVKYTLSIGLSNAYREEIFEIPKDLGLTDLEWEEYSEVDKSEALFDDYNYWVENILDGGWRIIDE